MDATAQVITWTPRLLPMLRVATRLITSAAEMQEPGRAAERALLPERHNRASLAGFSPLYFPTCLF